MRKGWMVVVPPHSRTARPNIAEQMKAMTPEQRRAHLAPAWQAKQFSKAKRLTRQILACDPALTPEQLDHLIAMLRGDDE